MDNRLMFIGDGSYQVFNCMLNGRLMMVNDG